MMIPPHINIYEKKGDIMLRINIKEQLLVILIKTEA